MTEEHDVRCDQCDGPVAADDEFFDRDDGIEVLLCGRCARRRRMTVSGSA